MTGTLLAPVTMAVFHDEVEIEDFQYDEDLETYFYPCPCGDNFCITKVTSDRIPPGDLLELTHFRCTTSLPPFSRPCGS